jgi:hypothetical protein
VTVRFFLAAPLPSRRRAVRLLTAASPAILLPS